MRKSGKWGYLVLGAFWVAFEYLRTLGYTGYPWGLLGVSQYAFLPVIQIADLTGGRPELPLSTGGTTAKLADVDVLRSDTDVQQRALPSVLANLDNQIALTNSWVWRGAQVRRGLWEEPLTVRAGRPVHLVLSWQALSSPNDSYTVFIHLLDEAGGYVLGHDYTPLGGAAPTYPWFPKWLPGQRYIDPYRLALPGDLPPGRYWLEVGMYGMTSLRRLPVVDLVGNLAGDRVILGSIQVE